MNGMYDSLPVPGSYLVSTIDARLQLLGEELMRGKVGGRRGDRAIDGRDPDDGLLADL